MSMSYASNKLRVPPGFEHLLEGLAREILREQPKNLVEFAAQYFRKKLQDRDGKTEETNSEHTTSQLQTTDPDNVQVVAASLPAESSDSTAPHTVGEDEEPTKPVEQEEGNVTAPHTVAEDEEPTKPIEQEEAKVIEQEADTETTRDVDDSRGDEEVTETNLVSGGEEVGGVEETKEPDTTTTEPAGGEASEEVVPMEEDDSAKQSTDANELGVDGEKQTTDSEKDQAAATEETEDIVEHTDGVEKGGEKEDGGGEEHKEEDNTASNPTE